MVKIHPPEMESAEGGSAGSAGQNWSQLKVKMSATQKLDHPDRQQKLSLAHTQSDTS
jgi:hypothetical protein